MADMLVVDDDRTVRRVLVDFLTDRGHTVHEAQSGSQALLLMRHHNFEVVFLDILMPEMSGLEVLRSMQGETRKPTVVMISGVTDHQMATEAMDLGAFDYINKPFDLEYLDKVVLLRLALAA